MCEICSGVAKVYFCTEYDAVSLDLWFQNDTASYARRTKTSVYTECNRRNGRDFGRVFLSSYYTDITQKNLYPKFNGYGDIGQRSMKL